MTKNYIGTLSAKLQNIVPPHECPINSATEIVNFASPKKDGAILRKKGLSLESVLAHSILINAPSSSSIELFTLFTDADKTFSATPTVLSFEDLSVGGEACYIDGTEIKKKSDDTVVGTIDFWTGTIALSPDATFSTTATIKVNDPVLSIFELSEGNGFQSYITDGRSIFKFEEGKSLSVAHLPYSPTTLTNLWWSEEVFIEGAATTRQGTALLSSGEESDNTPIFKFDPLNLPVTAFAPSLGSGETLQWAKRVKRLRDRTFACGVKTNTVLQETRVIWSAIGSPFAADAWESGKRAGAGFFEVDDIIENANVVTDNLLITTYKGFWSATPSFTASAPVHFTEVVDDFPSLRGFSALQSRGVLYAVNNRGVYTIGRQPQNISEEAGVRVNEGFTTSRDTPNVFSLADEKDGVYFFHSQQDEGLFSDRSVVFSLENGTFSFFKEHLTTGRNVSIDKSFVFSDYWLVKDLNFRPSQARRFDSRRIVLGDVQGNIYTRTAVSGKGNELVLPKDAKPVLLKGRFFLRGEGFETAKLNQVWLYDSDEATYRLSRLEEDGSQDEFLPGDFTQDDAKGRWIIQETFVYKSGEMNAFREKKRITFAELRLFLRSLTDENVGRFTLQTFQRTQNLLTRHIDLSQRKQSFLFSKWIKMLARSSGQSVGFRIFLSEGDIFSGEAEFPFDIESSQFLVV